jgi:FkbM family methyltransferase
MKPGVRKLIRTVQSHLFFLKEARDSFYYYSRRVLAKPHEAEFFALKFIPDDLPGCYVDIGANQGQSIESIKAMKPRVRVVSFEANRALAEKLRVRYCGDSAVSVFPYGLSDRADNRTLFVPVYRKFVYDGNASFDRDSATALYCSDTLFLFSRSKLQLRELDCSLQTLDEQQLEPLFIKIDVQGFEQRVVMGGLETIRRHEPILMIERLQDQPELAALLSSLGYEEYVFDDTGFQRGSASYAVNQLVMTERRSREVQLSSRRPVEGASLQTA